MSNAGNNYEDPVEFAWISHLHARIPPPLGTDSHNLVRISVRLQGKTVVAASAVSPSPTSSRFESVARLIDSQLPINGLIGIIPHGTRRRATV